MTAARVVHRPAPARSTRRRGASADERPPFGVSIYPRHCFMFVHAKTRAAPLPERRAADGRRSVTKRARMERVVVTLEEQGSSPAIRAFDGDGGRMRLDP